MSWTTPKSWAYKESLSSADMNTYVRDNFLFMSLVLPPIGTILPFYDYGGALTFDTTYFAYCNGQTKTINSVARVLPDLSNRYLVGFGTEAGADNGSAAWDTTVMGNSSHIINIAHTHTGPSHTHGMKNHTHYGGNHYHTLSAHTHNGPNHTHSVIGSTDASSAYHSHYMGAHTHMVTIGGGQVAPGAGPTAANPGGYATDGGSGGVTGADPATHAHNLSGIANAAGTGATGGPSNDTTSWSDSTGSGTTGAPNDNTSDAGGTGATGSAGSATQSIQPRSVKVRFIMRIA